MICADKLIVNISLAEAVVKVLLLGLSVNYITNALMKTIVQNAKTECRKGVAKMPDKKLTDKEIVKALEICGTYKGKCTDCPAFVKVDRSNCKNVLLGAVEIINRQNADLIDKEKQLQDALKSMAVNKTKVIDCEKEINRLQAKAIKEQNKNSKLRNERNRLQAQNKDLAETVHNLTIEKDALFDKAEELKAEIERLKPFENKIAEFKSHIRVEDMLVFASSLEEWLEFCENLKAEAIKEFCEKRGIKYVEDDV